MGVLKVLINGVWIPVGGSSSFSYGGGYETALLEVVSDGQQEFSIPEHGGADKTMVYLNGLQYNYEEGDYNIAGTVLTWADTALEEGEELFLVYVPLIEEEEE